MRMLASFALATGLAVVLTGSSSAQQRQQQGRGQFGGGQGGFASLIRNEGVQKELKMEKEQTDKATEAAKKVGDKYTEELTKLRQAMDEESRAKRTELTNKISTETLTAVSEVLKPEQVKRLKQIELQQAGVRAFTREDVQKALSVTDEQKPKIKAVADESATKTRELMGGGQGGQRPMRGQGGARPDQTKITALRKEMNEKMVAVLTDSQKGIWKEMTGDAFEVPQGAPNSAEEG